MSGRGDPGEGAHAAESPVASAAGHPPTTVRPPLAPTGRPERWAWRHKIRQNPRRAFLYRGVVALLGVLLIVAGLLTGPLPGPGGIPLVLLGLAVWASEFVWAHRLMMRFRRLVHRYHGWSRRRRVLFWVGLVAFFWACGYVTMITVGYPAWVPHWAAVWLDRLPAVHPR